MANVLVIEEAGQSTIANPIVARLAYDNQAPNAYSVTVSGNDTDKHFTYDGLTTQKWRIATIATHWIQFNSEFEDTGGGADLPLCDFIGVLGVPWETAGVTLSVSDETGVIASASGYRDNQPVFVKFDQRTPQRLRFEFASTTKNFECGEIYYGLSVPLPRNVSVGYQPARWSNDDRVTGGFTEGNQFAPVTVRKRGSTEKFNLSYIDVDYMETTWRNFVHNATGKPIFFLWNDEQQTHAVFGYWKSNRPTFTHSLFSSVDLTIKGVA